MVSLVVLPVELVQQESGKSCCGRAVRGAYAVSRLRVAFTLIELLVVVSILGLLLAVLLPTLQEARRKARTVVCQSNLHQLAAGWLAYAAEWEDHLPGSTMDYTGSSRQEGEEFCWLGTRGEDGHRQEFVPFDGTIFPYVGRMVDAYKCPEDRLDLPDKTPNGRRSRSTLYSYTAPVILTGAPIGLLAETIWPENFGPDYRWRRDFEQFGVRSLPWMIVEEHETQHLTIHTDSAWSNVDTLTDRHEGRAAVACIDGSVSVRAYQRNNSRISYSTNGIVDAWKVLYRLRDGRLISAGHNGAIRMGWIRNAPSDVGN